MRTGFLITARLKSTRLPLKILKDLNGRTVIERIIERAKEIKGISDIILCTSTNPQDKPLVDIARDNNIYYFRGDEKDVLKRLLDAAKSHHLDYFLGITADNPLFSTLYSNLIVNEIKRDGHDYIKVKGLPLGTATYGIRTKALMTVCEVKTIIDTEIWGDFIDRPEIFDVYTIQARGKFNRPELRLTLDYEQDYELLHNIYSNLPFKKVIKLSDVIDYLDKNPKIVKINQKCVQRGLDKKIKEKIEKGYRENLEKIRKTKNKIYNS